MMPQSSRLPRIFRHALVAVLTAVVVTSLGPRVAGARQARSAPAQEPINEQAAALADFQKRLQAYLDLREELSRKVKPLAQTADSAELTVRQEALAAAMKTERQHARPGDLIPPLVARQITEAVAADLRRRNVAAKKATLDEVPATTRPVINKTYPASAALPTVPPLLLANLPKLPDNLQYRFYGRHVVLLDGDLPGHERRYEVARPGVLPLRSHRCGERFLPHRQLRRIGGLRERLHPSRQLLPQIEIRLQPLLELGKCRGLFVDWLLRARSARLPGACHLRSQAGHDEDREHRDEPITEDPWEPQRLWHHAYFLELPRRPALCCKSPADNTSGFKRRARAAEPDLGGRLWSSSFNLPTARSRP